MNFKKRLVFLAYNMSGGGLESQIATITNAFADYDSHVSLLLWNDSIGFETNIKIINLEKKFGSKSFLSKVRKYIFIKNYLKENKIEALIDYRHRKKPWLEFILSYFFFKTKIFYTVHSSKIENYGFKNRFLVKHIFKNHQIICVSKGIASKVLKRFPHLKNVHTINNLIETPIKKINKIDLNFDYILFVGRLESPEKQVDLLINAYSKSKLYKKNIHLVLVGLNNQVNEFYDLIKINNLEEFVHFYSFQSDVNKFYQSALFTVLCSKYEGFGLTLVESLANQTPVISFDCPYGPSEIVVDNFNGLLIENQNFEKFEQAMILLSSDRDKLSLLKSNALISIQKFNRENILKQWEQVLNS